MPLWHDSSDYLELATQIKTPVIVVARNGRGTVTMPGSDITEALLLQAYLQAATEGCCEFVAPGCC